MVLSDVSVRLFFFLAVYCSKKVLWIKEKWALFYLVTSWKKGYYNKDLISRHIMLKSWSKIQNKVRIEEITP